MKALLSIALFVMFSGAPIAAQAGCPEECVESCSRGLAEEYVKCLNACLAGCNPEPVPVPSPPKPVEPQPDPKPDQPKK